VAMIVGRMEIGVRAVLVLGLSEMNLRKLREGKPIYKDAAEVGFGPLPVVITYGETEEAIAEDLEKNGLPLAVRVLVDNVE